MATRRPNGRRAVLDRAVAEATGGASVISLCRQGTSTGRQAGVSENFPDRFSSCSGTSKSESEASHPLPRAHLRFRLKFRLTLWLRFRSSSRLVRAAIAVVRQILGVNRRETRTTVLLELNQPPFSPMYDAKPRFPRPFRQKQIPSVAAKQIVN